MAAPRPGKMAHTADAPPIARVVQQITPQIYDWDFNVFELERRSGHRPLFAVVMALLEDQGLLDGWLLDRGTVERYFEAVEAAYNQNPYHNNTHAADVTQTAAVIMRYTHEFLAAACRGDRDADGDASCSDCSCASGKAGGQRNHGSHHNQHNHNQQQQQHTQQQANSGDGGGGGGGGGEEPGLSRMERFCIIFSSAVHDLGHPGVNNDFLIRTRDRQAVIYNDKSVNENMHCARAFELALAQEGCDVFSRFSDAEFAQARSLIIGMVLSTDMAVHFDLLNRFNATLEASPDPRSWGEKERALVLQMLVHLADLANPARPFFLASAWAERVVTEFMRQGDQEAARGLGVSPFCDREKVCMPAAQQGFVKMFAGPTLEAFGAVAPGFLALAAPFLEETRLKWEFLQQAGVKHPDREYPGFTPELLEEIRRRRGEIAAEVGPAAPPAGAPGGRAAGGGGGGGTQQEPEPQGLPQPQQPQLGAARAAG